MTRYALFLLTLTASAVIPPTSSAAEPTPLPVTRQAAPNTTDPLFDADAYQLSAETVAVKGKRGPAFRLAKSVLSTDEMGVTDTHQTEMLSARTWAKKVFHLTNTDTTNADLFLYGKAAKIRVNGTLIDPGQKLVSTGWTQVNVPVSLLKVGANEVVFADGGQLTFEPCRRPGASSKSTDGGRTWSNQQIGRQNNQSGDYLVRLRLDAYPQQGRVTTPLFDLWTRQYGDIAQPARLLSVTALKGNQLGTTPAGTSLTAWIRTGLSPDSAAQTWTDWAPLIEGYTPTAGADAHRWAQLRFDLTTDNPRETPTLEFANLAYHLQPLDKIDDAQLTVKARKEPEVWSSSVPFTYQEPTPRLKLLRERYQLDKVVADGKTEMEQLLLLRFWVRNQWHTAWEGGPAAWMPPWDAHVILEAKDNSDCLTMCTHFAAVYTQCCLALGWNARHCILDHHCVSEVWVQEKQKWVMMDPGNSKPRPDCGLHFERKGVPLSALELHQAYRDQATNGIEVCFTPKRLIEKIAPLCRPSPKPLPERPDTIPLSELPNYKVCQIENYRRYGFPDRNNYLTSLLPGELYQGYSGYAYDGYWWVGDQRDEPKVSPEYSRHLDPRRPQDIDWTLNWTRIHLARTTKVQELRVDLETFTPNLGRLERPDEKGAWKPVQASFVWKLEPGPNELRVRSVNKFDRPGSESSVTVTVGK